MILGMRDGPAAGVAAPGRTVFFIKQTSVVVSPIS